MRRHNKRSLALAEKTFDLIRTHSLPADPLSYELWYAYVSGDNRELNEAVDEILGRKGPVSAADLHPIYERHSFAAAAPERINAASEKIAGEVDQIVAMIEAAIGLAAGHGGEFALVQQKLGGSVDRDALRLIVEGLVHSAKEAEQESTSLGTSLRQSRHHINLLRNDLELVRDESLTDALTAVSNRRHFDQLIRIAVNSSRLDKLPLSLMLCDVDHFKKYNDAHGHQTGDDVLRLIAWEIKQMIRGDDSVARIGGEEFAIILPDTRLADARNVAENLRQRIAERKIVKRKSGQTLGSVTVSFGVVELRSADTPQDLIGRADACLYDAKKRGRNSVVGEDALDGKLVELAPKRRAAS